MLFLKQQTKSVRFFVSITTRHGDHIHHQMMRFMTFSKAKKGDVLYRPGDQQSLFYFVLHGKVMLLSSGLQRERVGSRRYARKELDKSIMKKKKGKVLSRKGGGRSKTVINKRRKMVRKFMKDNDGFGEFGIMPNQRRIATAICEKDS